MNVLLLLFPVTLWSYYVRWCTAASTVSLKKGVSSPALLPGYDLHSNENSGGIIIFLSPSTSKLNPNLAFHLPVTISIQNSNSYPVCLSTISSPMDEYALGLGIFQIYRLPLAEPLAPGSLGIPLEITSLNRLLSSAPGAHLKEIPPHNATIQVQHDVRHLFDLAVEEIPDGRYMIRAVGLWHNFWKGSKLRVVSYLMGMHTEGMEELWRHPREYGFVSNGVEIVIDRSPDVCVAGGGCGRTRAMEDQDRHSKPWDSHRRI